MPRTMLEEKIESKVLLAKDIKLTAYIPNRSSLPKVTTPTNVGSATNQTMRTYEQLSLVASRMCNKLNEYYKIEARLRC